MQNDAQQINLLLWLTLLPKNVPKSDKIGEKKFTVEGLRFNAWEEQWSRDPEVGPRRLVWRA